MNKKINFQFGGFSFELLPFELLFILTTDMTSYPVVQINIILAHLNYFSINSVF